MLNLDPRRNRPHGGPGECPSGRHAPASSKPRRESPLRGGSHWARPPAPPRRLAQPELQRLAAFFPARQTFGLGAEQLLVREHVDTHSSGLRSAAPAARAVWLA